MLIALTTVYFLNFERVSVSSPGRPNPPNEVRTMGLSAGSLRRLQTSSRASDACRAMKGMSLTFEKFSNPPDIGSRRAMDALA